MQYVYLIQCQQFYKIGSANNVNRRLSELSTGNPFPIKLIAFFDFEDAFFVESKLHKEFSSVRRNGEWFELSDQDIDRFIFLCTSFTEKRPERETDRFYSYPKFFKCAITAIEKLGGCVFKKDEMYISFDPSFWTETLDLRLLSDGTTVAEWAETEKKVTG